MKNLIARILVLTFAATTLAACARDLSSSTYTSDDTLNIVLEGQVLSTRNVKIKESERLGDNSTGALAGGVGGAAIGSTSKSNRTAAVAGGAIVGGLVGAATEQALGTNHGIEYVVKVDTSKLKDDYYEGSARMRNSMAAVRTNGIITVVQSKESKKDPVINVGQKVLVIISEKRTRIIPNLID